MLMRVSQYINDPVRAETRIHYIIYQEPYDTDRNPHILSFGYGCHYFYYLTDKKIFADVLDANIIKAVELDGVQIDSAKVILLITH